MKVVTVTQAIQRLLISMPKMMHRPQFVQCEIESNCDVLIWTEETRLLVLFIDIGGGAPVTNAIEWLIPLVIEQHLQSKQIPWNNVSFYVRDSMGAFDKVVIDAYDGCGYCEANWLPMPARARTLEGFRKCSNSIGFPLNERDIKLIQSVARRSDALMRRAA